MNSDEHILTYLESKIRMTDEEKRRLEWYYNNESCIHRSFEFLKDEISEKENGKAK